MNEVGVGLLLLAAVVSVRTAFAAPQFKENLRRMIREAEALTWNAKGDRTHPAAKGARLYADLFHRDVASRKLEIGKIFVDPRPVCCKGKTPSFTMRKVPAMTMDESLRARFGEEKTDE